MPKNGKIMKIKMPTEHTEYTEFTKKKGKKIMNKKLLCLLWDKLKGKKLVCPVKPLNRYWQIISTTDISPGNGLKAKIKETIFCFFFFSRHLHIKKPDCDLTLVCIILNIHYNNYGIPSPGDEHQNYGLSPLLYSSNNFKNHR